MPLDKTLSIALIISLLFHGIIFLPLSYFKAAPFKQSLPPLKIAYLQPAKAVPQQIKMRKRPTVPAAPKEVKEVPVTHSLEQKIDLAKVEENQKKQIEIPPELPKEKQPLYLDYYQSVREKIRRYVVQNYPRFIACGEVYAYFVLLSDGRIKEIGVDEDRSCQSWLLKAIAKKSIQQAAPFAAFPKELDQPQLPFRLLISFETER